MGMYAAVSTELDDMNISNLALNYPSYIYYEDDYGNVQELDTLRSAENIIWVSFDSINDNMKNAMVAIEDQRFYSHGGVDIKRTFGATAKYVLSKFGIGDASYGGSTITQQVIKNITQEKNKTPTRKVKEMLRAIALEKQLEKDEILTIYLNIVYFANQCYGVESAANTYFDKNASDLSIAQAATIAGITQYPSRFDPYTNPENCLNKRNIVLGKMLELKMISQEEYDKAVSSDLGVSRNSRSGSDKVNSYFVDQIITDVIDDLISQHGYTEDFAKQQLYNGGLKIYATIDPDIQDEVDNVYEKTSNFPNKSVQSAMTIIDPYTGEIKAMAGGIGKKTDSRVWNRATQTKRQPGSAIKPLSVYAPAIEEKKINEAEILTDEEITIGHDDWTPSNSYKGFKGDIPLKEAIGRSTNTIAVKVLDMLGLSTSFSYLENKFHFQSLQSEDKNYSSLALGGLTKGTSTTEMAAAYATFINSGKYIKPHTYTRVEDSRGNVLLEFSGGSTQAISPETAFIMSDLLLEPVNSSYGTARSAKLSNFTTYGKTGTTNDNYDKWFVGFTSKYVGAVWYGYDSAKSISASSNPATSVWTKVMSNVHSGLKDEPIKAPSGVTQARVCTRTGMLAKSSCPDDTCYFKAGDAPVSFCKGHSSFNSGTPENSQSHSNSSSSPQVNSNGTSENYDHINPNINVGKFERTSNDEENSEAIPEKTLENSEDTDSASQLDIETYE